MTPEWVDFNPPPTGCFINNVALGNKEVLWSFRRRMKPGGLGDEAPHSRLHPLPATRTPRNHTASALDHASCEASVAGASHSPAKHAAVFCVCSDRVEPPETPYRSTLRQQRRPVLFLLTTLDGHSSVGPVPAGPLPSLTGRDHRSPRTTAHCWYQGDCKGKSIQSLFFFCTWRTTADALHI